MKSGICLGETRHARLKPVEHRFAYPIFFVKVDLDELEELASSVTGFAYNRTSLFSIHDADYLRGYLPDSSSERLSIKQKLLSFIAAYFEENGSSESIPDIARIELITVPRVIKKVFNPVSFYRCYDSEERLVLAIAEVSNTFKESHIYVLDSEKGFDSKKDGRYRKYTDKKGFHVSPFNDLGGDYHFYFKENTEKIDIHVNIHRDGETVFTTSMSGRPLPFKTSNLIKNLPSFFYSAHAAFARITWEAAKLYFKKGLKVYTKPIASSDMTILKSGPSFIQSICMKLGLNYFSKFEHGCLEVSFPDGTSYAYGDPQSTMRANIHIKNYDFFIQGLLKADIGFGETFVDGYWETDDLTALLMLFVENNDNANPRSITSTYIPRFIGFLRHLARNNSTSRSKTNISAHYDMSNDLFSQFLDESMTYSCALYEDAEDSLAKAQENKLDEIIKKAQITKDDHVLEIGCGWGSFAIRAVKQTGCRVTGVTLSEEQRKLALERIKAEGLEDKITIAICDYRHIEQKFDKVVSIEMLEAVGHEYLGTFFKACDRVLKPDGLAVIQVITIPDQRYGQYRRNCDWIQQYIFPGGHCPSLGALTSSMSKNSEFMVEDLENIGDHYARTLREWWQAYQAKIPELRKLGFDERFDRFWEYYLCYCEAGFASRTLQTVQLVLTRPNNKKMPACVGY